jgi:hypothetical protein
MIFAAAQWKRETMIEGSALLFHVAKEATTIKFPKTPEFV